MDISIREKPTKQSKQLILTSRALSIVLRDEVFVNVMMKVKLHPMMNSPSRQLMPTNIPCTNFLVSSEELKNAMNSARFCWNASQLYHSRYGYNCIITYDWIWYIWSLHNIRTLRRVNDPCSMVTFSQQDHVGWPKQSITQEYHEVFVLVLLYDPYHIISITAKLSILHNVCHSYCIMTSS